MSGYKVSQGLNQVSKSPKALKNKVKRSKVQKQSLKPRYKGPGTKNANYETCLAGSDRSGDPRKPPLQTYAGRVRVPATENTCRCLSSLFNRVKALVFLYQRPLQWFFMQ